MSTLIGSLALFGLFYFPLRAAHGLWTREQLPSWFRYAGGVLAWGTFLSALMPLYAFGSRIASLLAAPNMSEGYELCLMLILMAIVAKTLVDRPDILRYAVMKPFLMECLVFRNPHLRRISLTEALERHEIEKIHLEQTGKPLPIVKDEPRMRAGIDPAEAERELARSRARGRQSMTLAQDLALLKKGTPVDLTDAFNVQTYRHVAHPLCEHVFRCAVDPASGTCAVHLTVPAATGTTLSDPDRFYRLKQDLYDFFHVLHGAYWLKPYAPFFHAFEVSCYRTEPDAFDLPRKLACLRINMERSELEKRKETIFSPSELHTIARVEILGDGGEHAPPAAPTAN